MHPRFSGGRHGRSHGDPKGVYRSGHHDHDFGRHRRRIFESGDFQVLLLSLLADSPRHGYELIRLIEQMFGGAYAPSPGVIYPTLTMLEEQDFAVMQSKEGEARKCYAITAAGRRWLEQQADALAGIHARIQIDARAMNSGQIPEAIRQAMRTLKHALVSEQSAWTDARIRRVQKLIEQAIAEIAAVERP